jgi:hypothetical protein
MAKTGTGQASGQGRRSPAMTIAATSESDATSVYGTYGGKEKESQYSDSEVTLPH